MKLTFALFGIFLCTYVPLYFLLVVLLATFWTLVACTSVPLYWGNNIASSGMKFTLYLYTPLPGQKKLPPFWAGGSDTFTIIIVALPVLSPLNSWPEINFADQGRSQYWTNPNYLTYAYSQTTILIIILIFHLNEIFSAKTQWSQKPGYEINCKHK